MYVTEIADIKNKLEDLRSQGLIAAWELPYENLLTRLSAAIFFIDPVDDKNTEEVWETLGTHPQFNYCINEDKLLSALAYRITFSTESNQSTS